MSTPTGAPPAGRREQNKAEKHERIVRSAAKLFNERGFELTTTAAVAAAAGIGTGTLFLYFPTKEDLLVAVFRVEVGRAWDDAFASVDPDAPLLEQVLQAFGSVVAYHEGDPGLARSFFKELQFVSDPIADGVRQFIRGYFRALEALLAKATERGELMSDVSTRTLASNLYAAWYTLIQRRHAGHLSLEDLHMRLRESFELQFRGITAPKRTLRPRSR